MSDRITVPRPHVAHGPAGVPVDVADADYLRSATRNIVHARCLGSNLTETVVKLLEDAADAIETGATHPSRTIPARSTDPETSHKATAAVTIKAGSQRHRLLSAFGLEAAADGLTDEEAADLADGVPYRSEYAKRCSELRAAGHIEVVDGTTRPGIAGLERLVSRITPAGRAALQKAGSA